jgi:hypothetical protein
MMPLALTYKIITQPEMNRTKQKVSAAVQMLTALVLTILQNAQIKLFFFVNPANCSKTFSMISLHKIHKMNLNREIIFVYLLFFLLEILKKLRLNLLLKENKTFVALTHF